MFVLSLRSPFALMEQMEKRVEDLFDRFSEDGINPTTAWAPTHEVYARDGKLVIRCDVPGVDPADIRVAVSGRTLTISGERKAAEQIPGDDY
jgi:HSP20 family molecular chaperone IbpA